jgi:hypothetical protein
MQPCVRHRMQSLLSSLVSWVARTFLHRHSTLRAQKPHCCSTSSLKLSHPCCLVPWSGRGPWAGRCVGRARGRARATVLAWRGRALAQKWPNLFGHRSNSAALWLSPHRRSSHRCRWRSQRRPLRRRKEAGGAKAKGGGAKRNREAGRQKRPSRPSRCRQGCSLPRTCSAPCALCTFARSPSSSSTSTAPSTRRKGSRAGCAATSPRGGARWRATSSRHTQARLCHLRLSSAVFATARLRTARTRGNTSKGLHTASRRSAKLPGQNQAL